jgi:hypothetical protein
MRAVYAIPAVIVLVLLIGAGVYLYVIPRSGLSVRTIYHETPGGGGTGGVINVNIVMENTGNQGVDGLSFEIGIKNSTGAYMTGRSGQDLSIPPGKNAEIKLNFVGSQYDTYEIKIHIRFDSGGDTTISDLLHRTVEDEMNLVFEDDLG